MITIELSDGEVGALHKIADAALRGSGISILREVFWLQSTLQIAQKPAILPKGPKQAPETEAESAPPR